LGEKLAGEYVFGNIKGKRKGTLRGETGNAETGCAGGKIPEKKKDWIRETGGGHRLNIDGGRQIVFHERKRETV